MKNILIITPKLSSGGVERVASNLSIGLSKKNNVFLCVFDNSGTDNYEHSGQLIDLNSPFSPNKAIYQLKNIKDLIKYMLL